MTRRTRNAFTLIELLVVMTIIAILVALLMAAVQGSREGARKMNCQSNLHQVAEALNLHNNDKGTYPGRTNKVGVNPTSWVVPITPYLAKRGRIFDQWRRNNLVEELIPILVCPSDTGDRDETVGSLSYVVNCGMRPDLDPFDLNPPLADKLVYNGIFYDVNAGGPTSGMELVDNYDGSSYTLLLTENIQAGTWIDSSIKLTGFVWYLDTGPDALNTDIHPLNEDKFFEGTADVHHARPSCYHSSGANFAFCDGHVEFFNDGLDYQVYRQLMTPYGDKSDASTDPILDEATF